ncbi:MAG: MBL fold metallo-hydrolase [Solirubrobacteraceae bacterium]|nr:MBL fold metallo-hydrolase [Solirubrobacteraceae bacterium]
MTSPTLMERPVEDLYATPGEPLSFAPEVHVRAFLLRREAGNVLLYNVAGLASAAPELERLGGVERHYLNHSHEAMFGSAGIAAPLFVHERDHDEVAPTMHVRGTFSRRHRPTDDFEVIPTPGHTPGATAYLWDSGVHRFLFTGDSLYLGTDGWHAGVLSSSDRGAYLESLALIRDLDFDVLVPWAAPAGAPYVSATSATDTRARLDEIIERVRGGATR